MPGGVEFLEQGVADEPAAPPRRVSWAVRVLVVAVALAAGIGWVVTRPSDPPRRPAAAESFVPPSFVHPAPPPVPGFARNAESCTFGAPVSDEIAAAMYRFLPGITIANLTASRCVRWTGSAQRIVSESVSGAVGGVGVQVQLTARGTDFPPRTDGVYRGGPPTTMIGGVEAESAGVKVRVSASGPSGAHAPMVKLRRLADYLSLNTVL